MRDQRGAVANADNAVERLEQEVERKRLALGASNADVESVSDLEHRRGQGLELRRRLRRWAPLQTELALQEG